MFHFASFELFRREVLAEPGVFERMVDQGQLTTFTTFDDVAAVAVQLFMLSSRSTYSSSLRPGVIVAVTPSPLVQG